MLELHKKVREIALGEITRAWESSNELNFHEVVLDLNKKLREIALEKTTYAWELSNGLDFH